MSFKEFIKELNGGRVEGELIKTIFYSLITSFIVLGLLYYLKFRFIENFMTTHGYFLFFSALSYAIILPSIRQVRAYKEFLCMAGMMVGMTIGMIAGFLPGFFLASTNGMFIGSVFGMTVGMALGIWNGKCCGVMGVMEGMMSGFMGGLMGAMTAFMLFNDHLIASMVIVFSISAVILFSLNYMVYKEMKFEERKIKDDHLWTLVISFILITLTIWLMMFGPRSGVFG
ncbi:hypothetical protein COU53_01165 [Candidatus Pacearchaeota archaeon CG10_big_fil_rev_8_21_14_0_10_30_48]|nr:MAG: hypothetical protein COU53_01165 [Candidatus Pacearchaeota archaeon CG10_big_fil_rev_8_21_14_0_10_30_48]